MKIETLVALLVMVAVVMGVSKACTQPPKVIVSVAGEVCGCRLQGDLTPCPDEDKATLVKVFETEWWETCKEWK